MAQWREWAEISKRVEGSVLTIGNFDGVHLGHQEIVRTLVGEARKRNVPSVAIMFDPHPTAILGTKVPPKITTLQERSALLETFGIDHIFIQKFDKLLANTSAESYLSTLREGLGMEYLCIGPTTHLGKGREGNPEKIASLGRARKFDVTIVPPFFMGSELVSSSRIRRQIEEGEVELAGRCLGRLYCTAGRVVAGDGIGRVLGFPTANLHDIPTLIPARGVYAVWAEVDGAKMPAAANVGYRPTVTDHPKLGVEIHILEFRGSLLGRELPVEWVAWLRDEKKFDSVDTLKAQIAKDCEMARGVLKV